MDDWKQEWHSARNRLWTSDLTRDLLEDNEIWALVISVARIDEVTSQAVDSLEISGVAKHTFTLAQQLNLFYHKHHIISETNSDKQAFYLTIVDTARKGLLILFHLLGIEVPERM